MIWLNATCRLTLLLSCLGLPLQAAEVNKWVDEDGVTHYSDAPPDAASSEVTTVKLREHRPSPGRDKNSDYYSIKNQWARLKNERIQTERLKLQQEKLKAAQESQPPRVVYVKEPKDEDDSHRRGYGYVIGYPRIGHSKHRRGRHFKQRKFRSRIASGLGYIGYRSGIAVGKH